MPRNGDDVDRARYIVSLGYARLEPVINDMLRWLRVSESPVADVFIDFFSENGTLASEAVSRILRTSRLSVLRYVIVTRVLPDWPRQAIEKLEGSLSGFVTDSGEPETALKSLELMIKHELGNKDWLKGWLEFIMERMERNAAEARRIRETFYG